MKRWYPALILLCLLLAVLLLAAAPIPICEGAKVVRR